MGILDRKITAFTQTLSARPNRERNQGVSIKATIDSSPEELRVALNGVIDDVNTDYVTKEDFQRIALEQIPDDTITINKLKGDIYTTTNVGNNYSVTIPNITSLSQLAGKRILIKFNADMTGNSTLNVNQLGPQNIMKPTGFFTSGKSTGLYTVVWDKTNFMLQGSDSSGNAIPEYLLAGYTAGTDNGDIVGTMPNVGSVGTQNLTSQNQEFTIPLGYHNGLGKVKAAITNLVANVIKAGTVVGGITGTFTADATATAADIANGKTAGINGQMLTGTNTNIKWQKGNFADNSSVNYISLPFTPATVLVETSVAYNGVACNAFWSSQLDPYQYAPSKWNFKDIRLNINAGNWNPTTDGQNITSSVISAYRKNGQISVSGNTLAIAGFGTTGTVYWVAYE